MSLAMDRDALKARLAKAERRGKIRAFLLVAPLLAFVLLSFVVPIANLVTQAFYGDLVASTLPKTSAELAWEFLEVKEIGNFGRLVAREFRRIITNHVGVCDVGNRAIGDRTRNEIFERAGTIVALRQFRSVDLFKETVIAA